MDQSTAMLPQEEQQASAMEETDAQRGQRLAIVESLSAILKEKRKDAIEGRKASGIEEIWAEDQDHYDGEDEATRGTTSKGRSATDGLGEVKKKAVTRSTVFLKITRPYCDAAAARVSDMLLPTDDRNWALRPTPLPQMEAALEDMRPVNQVVPPQAIAQKQGGVMGAIRGMFGGQQQPAAPAPTPTVAEVAQQEMDRALEKSEAAQKQIDDWLVECRYHAEVRKVIEDATRVGAGILKGPVPAKHKSRRALKAQDGWAMEIVQEIKPESRRVAVDKFYPDPNCGDDIHRGSYTWEEDDITARALADLKGVPGYIDEMIDACIEEGPISPTTGTKKNKDGEKTKDKDLFQIWYYHGYVSSTEMQAAGCKCGDKKFYPCVVTMVNDRTIKVSLNPFDSGEFPYDVMVWQPRMDHWAGVGVSRQMRECQKGANAAIRNVMDNAGLGGGPQIIVDRNKLMPANGRWEIVPRQIWYTKDGSDNVDVARAFMFAEVPIIQQELMAILQFWLKEAEDVTGLPMLLQGQQGKVPDTVGVTTILNNNGSTVLRRIARTFDDRITEPHIERYYEYLLLYGPDECKGDFTIDARGSSALVERDMQNQQLMQLVSLSLNPLYGLDPELVIGEVLKGMKFDLKRLVLSQQKKDAAAQQQQPQAPQIQVAQIREQGETQRQQQELQAEAAQADKDRQLQLVLGQVKERIESIKDAGAREIAFNDLKAMLASTGMKLAVTKDLATADHIADLHKHHVPSPVVTPAIEPPGKAPAGQAFEK